MNKNTEEFSGKTLVCTKCGRELPVEIFWEYERKKKTHVCPDCKCEENRAREQRRIFNIMRKQKTWYLQPNVSYKR